MATKGSDFKKHVSKSAKSDKNSKIKSSFLCELDDIKMHRSFVRLGSFNALRSHARAPLTQGDGFKQATSRRKTSSLKLLALNKDQGMQLKNNTALLCVNKLCIVCWLPNLYNQPHITLIFLHAQVVGPTGSRREIHTSLLAATLSSSSWGIPRPSQVREDTLSRSILGSPPERSTQEEF